LIKHPLLQYGRFQVQSQAGSFITLQKQFFTTWTVKNYRHWGQVRSGQLDLHLQILKLHSANKNRWKEDIARNSDCGLGKGDRS